MKLPSQLDSNSMLLQLEELEEKGSIGKDDQLGNDPSKDPFPSSCATWLLSQLKGPFDIKSPPFYPFPCASKEMFSWVERNNQISEEALRNLIYDEVKLQKIKTELKEYSESIPKPKQTKLNTKTPIDEELLGYCENKSELATVANCFIWQWGKFSAFIAPQEVDLSKISDFQEELTRLKINPDAFILIPYGSDPLEKLDEYYGSELWHTFPPTEPLLWEETKFYLEALRCQNEFAKNLSNKQIFKK